MLIKVCNTAVGCICYKLWNVRCTESNMAIFKTNLFGGLLHKMEELISVLYTTSEHHKTSKRLVMNVH